MFKLDGNVNKNTIPHQIKYTHGTDVAILVSEMRFHGC